MQYSSEFKKAAVRKLLSPNGAGLKPLARKLGVTPQTLRNWRNRYADGENPNMAKRPKDWTAEQKLMAIMETSVMDEEEKGAYCRENGIYSSQLEIWHEQCLASVRKGPKVDPVKRSLENIEKRAETQREGTGRGGSAFGAEKKAEAYWRSGEDDEEN